jgi:hypothetical protein
MLIKNPDVRNRLGLLCMPRHPGNLFLLIPVKIRFPWEQPTISRLTPHHLQQTHSASVAGTVRVLIEKSGKMPDVIAKTMLIIRKNQRKNIFKRLGLVEVGAWAVDVE